MDEHVNNLCEVELALLKSEDLKSSLDHFPILQLLQRGEYQKIIEQEKIQDIFSVPDDYSLKIDKPLDFFRSIVNTYLNKHDSIAEEFELFCIGVACLNAFIQANWTGPEFICPISLLNVLNPLIEKCFPGKDPQTCDIIEYTRLALAEDGEEICDSIINAQLLVTALAILGSQMTSLKTLDWWLLRATYIHQQVLDEQSPSLFETLDTLCRRVLNLDLNANDKYLQVLSRLEVARVYLHYGRIEYADKEINSVLSLLNMEINLAGALGKRTYYQIKEVAQISLNVKVDHVQDINNILSQDEVEIEYPVDVSLNDEIRMPNIAFSNPQDGCFPDLFPLEQAALLAAFVLKRKSQAKDHLQNEELIPFLNCLLSHPKVWSFQVSALHLRSRLECDHKRTVERSLLQTQILMELNNNKTPISGRLNLFYCSYAPPSFVIASECASILVSVGSVQSALDIYLQLQMWDEVIACYNYLKLRHKAAEVINEQIKKGGETVKLLCSLGDATDDVSCYERAWVLSNHRSAQAQRHWGMYYFNKRNYKESIDHFNLSLSKNSLQISIWFRLGYANLMEHRWEESASAYRRYCDLEPGSFEAWNNMAKAYILLGQKNRAYHALHEAIKCNYDTWQVWDNLMAVSSDCGEFEEVIHCYHRILDLKDKHIDEQILIVLTSVILKNIKDCRGQPTSLYRKKALELFGRITSKVMNNPKIWELYAQLTSTVEDQTPVTRSKVIHYYQKAYTAVTQDNSWYSNVESMQNVLNISEKLAGTHLLFAEVASSSEAVQSLSSAKFSLINVLTKVNEQLKIMDKSEVKENFLNDVSSLQSTLENVQAELARLKGS